MQLYNNLSNNERAELIKKAGKDRLTISFYKYAKIGNPELLRNHLFLFWNDIDVLGRIYVAHEGIKHNCLCQPKILVFLKRIWTPFHF